VSDGLSSGRKDRTDAQIIGFYPRRILNPPSGSHDQIRPSVLDRFDRKVILPEVNPVGLRHQGQIGTIVHDQRYVMLRAQRGNFLEFSYPFLVRKRSTTVLEPIYSVFQHEGQFVQERARGGG